MGRRKKHPRRAAGTAAAAVPSGDLSIYSGYSGANWSDSRAQVWWPTLNTRLELDGFSRDELMRRIRWLHGNEGFIRGLIKNSADLVGYQTPQAKSGDEDWDELAEHVFRDRCLTPQVFDHAGKYDFEDAQLMLSRGRFKDGDIFTVLSSWPNGAAMFAFYEAHQLRNPDKRPESEIWKDGVLLGPGGRHIAYGFRDPDSDKVTIIPARDVIYHGAFDSPGHVRAIPPLAHAVNHAIDITEVWSNLKQAIKAASLFGAVREQAVGADPLSKRGLAGTRATVTTPDGGELEISKVWAGAQIPRLGAGESMKILHDDRPSPNVREFVRDLIRDISTGFGLPPEVIWEMSRLSGPGVRFVLDVADRWIKCQQRTQRRWCKRVWVYTIAKEIKSGRLPLPKAKDGQPARWWAVSFTAQRSLTIDRGKESKSRLDEIDAGVGTWAGWEELDGTDWKDRARQRVEEVAFAKAECAAAGLEYRDVYPLRQGAAKADPEETGGRRNDSEEEEDE